MRKRKTPIFLLLILGMVALPLAAGAELCRSLNDKAHQTFDAASAAHGQGDYARAARLYEEAGRYFQQVAEMTDCSCPKIVRSARNNARISRGNAADSRQALKDQRRYQSGKNVVALFNQARDAYNRGNTYARNGQWQQAVSAFENAAAIWEGIASPDTDNGRKAGRNAAQARQLADKARQRLR